MFVVPVPVSVGVRANLQCSQEVACLSQSGPGSVQLLQQFILCLLQCGDLSLSCPDVLLPLLHLLLQPSHLRQINRNGYPERLGRIHNLHSVTLMAAASVQQKA